MRTPEHPFDGAGSNKDGTPSYDWLDEWLCEYVDGTMDPSLEAVFEKYVEANPELRAHVKRLQQTRELLCGCDLPEEPSPETQADVCAEVENDLLHSSSESGIAGNRRLAVLGFATSVVAALVIGFLAGSMFVDPVRQSPAQAVPTAEEREPERQTITPQYGPSPPGFEFEASAFPSPQTVGQGPDHNQPPQEDTSFDASTFTTVDAR